LLRAGSGAAVCACALSDLGERLGDPDVQHRLRELGTSSARIGDLLLGEIDRSEAMSWPGCGSDSGSRYEV
jgi:hypothetical protein